MYSSLGSLKTCCDELLMKVERRRGVCRTPALASGAKYSYLPHRPEHGRRAKVSEFNIKQPAVDLQVDAARQLTTWALSALQLCELRLI